MAPRAGKLRKDGDPCQRQGRLGPPDAAQHLHDKVRQRFALNHQQGLQRRDGVRVVDLAQLLLGILTLLQPAALQAALDRFDLRPPGGQRRTDFLVPLTSQSDVFA